MGKLNEIQQQTTMSYGNNSFTTTIEDNTVKFDSARDSFTFVDPVNVPSLTINGQASQPFTSEEKTKLSQVTTPMNIKGRVDSASDLPTEDVRVGDVYLVGESGSETFEEYVCTEISGSPEQPVWENLGHVKVQADWNQNDSNADDYVKNRTHYVEEEERNLITGTITSTAEGWWTISSNTNNDFEYPPYGSVRIYISIGNVTHSQVFTADESSCGGTFNLSEYGMGQYAVSFYCSQYSVSINGNGQVGTSGVSAGDTYRMWYVGEDVHTLDEKYIPSSIIRNLTDGSTTGSVRGVGSAAEDDSYTMGQYALAEGYNTTASAYCSHAEGYETTASGDYGPHAEGNNTTASGSASHAEGRNNTASGSQSHAEGYETTASGSYSHAEGYETTASAQSSHAEGVGTTASARSSHAEGVGTTASGYYSHAEGCGTIAAGGSSSVFGEYNVEDAPDPNDYPSWAANTPYVVGDKISRNNSFYRCIEAHSSQSYFYPEYWQPCNNATYVEIVGNGISNDARSNARTLDWSGNQILAGDSKSNSVTTKKLTISSIDPTDVFMHSEIINASSDVAFSRVVANADTDKTDGYVEILYKVSSGVTCSAYINSTDVALTADGAWHKLEQGCDPADGVEIHINNSSPVADATMEVISKVYYI